MSQSLIRLFTTGYELVHGQREINWLQGFGYALCGHIDQAKYGDVLVVGPHKPKHYSLMMANEKNMTLVSHEWLQIVAPADPADLPSQAPPLDWYPYVEPPKKRVKRSYSAMLASDLAQRRKPKTSAPKETRVVEAYVPPKATSPFSRSTSLARAKTVLVEIPSKVIALEGNIGVGKSTLCRKMTQTFPNAVDTYAEDVNQEFLKLFYGNPSQYGFAFQMLMLSTRLNQLRSAQKDKEYGRAPPRENYFWDRSMFGDYMFALYSHLSGNISADEMAVYENMLGGDLVNGLPKSLMSTVDLFVLFNDEPKNCKQRVEDLRKNNSESGIPLAYYEGIDDMHFALFQHMMEHDLAKVAVLSWGQYDDETKCRKAFNKAIDSGSSVSMSRIQTQPPSPPESGTFVHTEQTITDMYALINPSSDQAPTSGLMAQFFGMISKSSVVYIPFDVHQVSAANKNLDEALVAKYGLTFYTNCYKRVLLWHLSQGTKVILYPSVVVISDTQMSDDSEMEVSL